jgi:hypothetical protein
MKKSLKRIVTVFQVVVAHLWRSLRERVFSQEMELALLGGTVCLNEAENSAQSKQLEFSCAMKTTVESI